MCLTLRLGFLWFVHHLFDLRVIRSQFVEEVVSQTPTDSLPDVKIVVFVPLPDFLLHCALQATRSSVRGLRHTALRERLDDIREIANARLYRAKKPLLTKAQLGQLKSYHWPGNVRQLLNVLRKAEAYNTNDYTDCLSDEPD